MSYRPFVTELATLLDGVTYDTEIDTVDHAAVPYGIYKDGILQGCIVRNGWLSGGVFVAIHDSRCSTESPTMYGFSSELQGTEDTYPIWAIGLHLQLLGLPLEDMVHYTHQFYRVDSVIQRVVPGYHGENDTLYGYLNGVPFLRIVRGKTPVFWARPDILTYHQRFMDVTAGVLDIWNQYLGEVMRLGLAPPASQDQVYSYLRVVQAMGQLMEVPMDYSET